MNTMHRLANLGAVLALVFAFAVLTPNANADGGDGGGGGGGDSGDRTVGGENSGSREWRVAKEAIAAKDVAKEAIAAKDYAQAVPLLKQVVAKQPTHADALNYLGYAHSRTGQYEVALDYYCQALALVPDHAGANECLGELYLKMGNLAAAEGRLEVLDKACFVECPEFDDLKFEIERYRKNGGYPGEKHR